MACDPKPETSVRSVAHKVTSIVEGKEYDFVMCNSNFYAVRYGTMFEFEAAGEVLLHGAWEGGVMFDPETGHAYDAVRLISGGGCAGGGRGGDQDVRSFNNISISSAPYRSFTFSLSAVRFPTNRREMKRSMIGVDVAKRRCIDMLATVPEKVRGRIMMVNHHIGGKPRDRQKTQIQLQTEFPTPVWSDARQRVSSVLRGPGGLRPFSAVGSRCTQMLLGGLMRLTQIFFTLVPTWQSPDEEVVRSILGGTHLF
ncbi:hypothetical protein B0H13DRAFT_1883430 [Mycena leptocephala]|nr:hypothetical protein B0H13DRAFT_1883430 [Mycena leptocephala]